MLAYLPCAGIESCAAAVEATASANATESRSLGCIGVGVLAWKQPRSTRSQRKTRMKMRICEELGSGCKMSVSANWPGRNDSGTTQRGGAETQSRRGLRDQRKRRMATSAEAQKRIGVTLQLGSGCLLPRNSASPRLCVEPLPLRLSYRRDRAGAERMTTPAVSGELSAVRRCVETNSFPHGAV